MTSSSNEGAAYRASLAALILAALAVASAFITPATRDLIFGDESRYARVAAEMAAAGEWVVPSLDGRAYTDKPPLHFDAIIALASLFGFHTTWTFVLPSLLSFVALTSVVGLAGRRWFGPAAGALAAFLFATFLFAWGSAQTARMDLEYALAVTLAVVLLRDGMQRERNGLMVAAGAATGIGILIKGPAIVVIVSVVWAIEAFRLRKRPRWGEDVATILMMAIPAAWVGVIAARKGAWAAFDLVVTQNVGRAIDSFAHAKPFWFYAARFPLLFFPWFLLLVGALIGARRRGNAHAFCAIWFGVIFLFFSTVSGKLDVYLLPAAAPAALLIAGWVTSAADRGGGVVAALNVPLLVLGAAASFAAPWIAASRAGDSPEVGLLLRAPFAPVAMIAGISAAIGALLHALPAVRRPLVSVLVSGAALMAGPLAAAALMMGFVNQVYSSRPLIEVLRAHRLERASLVVYEGFHPWGRDFDFAGVRRIREADPWTLKKAKVLPAVVVTRSSRATELGRPLRKEYERIASIRIRRKDYDVYRLTAP